MFTNADRADDSCEAVHNYAVGVCDRNAAEAVQDDAEAVQDDAEEVAEVGGDVSADFR